MKSEEAPMEHPGIRDHAHVDHARHNMRLHGEGASMKDYLVRRWRGATPASARTAIAEGGRR